MRGLSTQELDILAACFAKHPHILSVTLYGSRALGTHTERSDIDLALDISQNAQKTLALISLELEESNLVPAVDLQLLAGIKNDQLLEHIKRAGVIIYENCHAIKR